IDGLDPALQRARSAERPALVCVKTNREANLAVPQDLLLRFVEVYQGPTGRRGKVAWPRRFARVRSLFASPVAKRAALHGIRWTFACNEVSERRNAGHTMTLADSGRIASPGEYPHTRRSSARLSLAPVTDGP